MDSGELSFNLGKFIGGLVGGIVGWVVMKFGWRKAKEGRERNELRLPRDQQLRSIEQGEWEGLRDAVRDVRHDLEEMEKDYGRIESRLDRDHERLGNVVLKVSMLEERLNALSDHCDHCPGHGGMRR